MEEEEEDNIDDVSLDNDDLADDDCQVNASRISIFRRILATPKVEEEDWCHTTIFQTPIIYGPKAKKLVSTGGVA